MKLGVGEGVSAGDLGGGGAGHFQYFMAGEMVLCISEYLLPSLVVRHGRLSGSRLIDRKGCMCTIAIYHTSHTWARRFDISFFARR